MVPGSAAPGNTASGSASAPAVPLPALSGLERLVEAGLVHLQGGVSGAAGTGRYGMLETVREFALERLLAIGAQDNARERHTEYCLALAEAAEAELWGERQGAWLDYLEREYSYLEAALRLWVTRGRAYPSVRLAGALYRYWYVRGRVTEGREWLAGALALPAAGVPARVPRQGPLRGRDPGQCPP